MPVLQKVTVEAGVLGGSMDALEFSNSIKNIEVDGHIDLSHLPAWSTLTRATRTTPVLECLTVKKASFKPQPSEVYQAGIRMLKAAIESNRNLRLFQVTKLDWDSLLINPTVMTPVSQGTPCRTINLDRVMPSYAYIC
jgi:hypothetical protein